MQAMKTNISSLKLLDLPDQVFQRPSQPRPVGPRTPHDQRVALAQKPKRFL